MTRQAFGKFIKQLCAYYEKSIPPRETIELWLEKVECIPDETATWISAKITDSNERFPLNIPSVMLTLWPKWLLNHPDKRSIIYAGGCRDCDDYGWLHVRKDGHVYAFRCRCGKLNNSATDAWLSELLHQGYVDDLVEDIDKYRVEPIDSLWRNVVEKMT